MGKYKKAGEFGTKSLYRVKCGSVCENVRHKSDSASELLLDDDWGVYVLYRAKQLKLCLIFYFMSMANSCGHVGTVIVLSLTVVYQKQS